MNDERNDLDERAGDGGATAAAEHPAAGGARGGGDSEADILRDELTRLQEDLAELHAAADEARKETDELRDRYLRARADLDNLRRRSQGEVERSREAGLDSAVLTVLAVYDDLVRALQAADNAADPTTIVPGVRAVKEGLERNLETLDIRAVGVKGEPFDPDVHEALAAVPAAPEGVPGTVADVIQAGFKRGDRLVRPARVVVYQEQDG